MAETEKGEREILTIVTVDTSSEKYIDVDCKAFYRADPRVWRCRVFLDLETGAIGQDDDVYFSPSDITVFELAHDVPEDIRAALRLRAAAGVEILESRKAYGWGAQHAGIQIDSQA